MSAAIELRQQQLVATVQPSAHPVAVLRDDGQVALWHSLAPEPVRILDFGSREAAADFVSHVLAGTDVKTGDTATDQLLGLTDVEARVAAVGSGAHFAPQFLSLMLAESCNLGCDYCIAGTNMEDSRLQGTTRMAWQTAKASLDWFEQASAGANESLVINFSGGEPLLNWPVMQRVLAELPAYPRLSSAALSVNTNATLVTPTIASVLAEHSVGIATSLDGTPEASDLIRVTRRGKFGASENILSGWRTLLDAGCDLTGFMATFDDRNYDSLNASVVDFAASWGFTWLRVDCDVIHISARSAAETVDRLWEICQAGRETGLLVEGFWSTAAHNLLNPTAGRPSAFCGAVGGQTVTVHPSGRLSACGFSAGDHGRVARSRVDLAAPVYRALVDAYVPGARTSCRGCEIEGSCAGGCNIAREHAAATGDSTAVDFNCDVYRAMTRRLLATPYL